MKKIINTIENDKRTSTQNLMQEIWSAIEEGATDFEIDDIISEVQFGLKTAKI